MTLEQNQKIAWLNRASFAEKKLQALEHLKNRDKERAEKITANYGGNTKGKSDSKINNVENALIAYADSEEKYLLALADYNSIRNEIQQAIYSIPDLELQSIFIYRYLNSLSVPQIAECLNYDTRTIQRKHKSALDLLSINNV